MKITITRPDPSDPLVRAFAAPMSLENEIEFCKLEAVEALLQFMKREGITRTELAVRMGVPPSRITRLLGGAENLTIATLVRAGRAVGAERKLTFQNAAANHAPPAHIEADPVSKVAEAPVPYRVTRKPKS